MRFQSFLIFYFCLRIDKKIEGLLQSITIMVVNGSSTNKITISNEQIPQDLFFPVWFEFLKENNGLASFHWFLCGLEFYLLSILVGFIDIAKRALWITQECIIRVRLERGREKILHSHSVWGVLHFKNSAFTFMM